MTTTTDIYLQPGELEVLMRDTMGRRSSVGGQCVIPLAFPSLRVLPHADGTYERWLLLRVCELRGIELGEKERAELERWRSGGIIGASR